MFRRLLLSVILLAALAPCLPAQFPQITRNGDPSVRADTIYALAVDPLKYAEYGAVVLFEDGLLRVERDGTSRRTFRTVAQVITQDAAKEWGQWSLSYRPDRERITLNWIRVVRADGTVLSDRPEVDHETFESADENQVYSGRKVRQLTLGGVAAGTIVDVSYTLETYRPTLPGDLYQRWFVSQWSPVRRLRYMVDAPAGRPVTIATPNFGIVPTVQERGGRTTHTWTDQEIPALTLENFSAFPNTVVKEVRIWGWAGWTKVGEWYARLGRGRDAITPAVSRAFAERAGDTTDVDALLEIAQRWIAQDFRYVSVGLGDGNYQPRLPSDVVQTRFGDCKDKAALFIALARSFGVEAFPVLLNSSGLIDSVPVSLERFDHAIVALERDGELTFLDLTDDLLPYGFVPLPLQGTLGLMVRPNGLSHWVRLPESPLEENWIESRITGTIQPDGTFDGALETAANGTSEYSVRLRLRGAAQEGNEGLIEAAEEFAEIYLPGAKIDSVELNDGLSLDRQPYIYVELTSKRLVQPAGERYLLHLPDRYLDAAALVAEIEGQDRRFPIDAARLNDASTALLVLELTLPPGWRAELPRSVLVDGLFGRYRATYTQKGRTLRMERELTGRRGTEPPDSVGALLAWLRGIGEDRVESILLDPGGGLRPDSSGLFQVPTRDTTTIALRFAWPAGMEAEVESEHTKIVQHGTVAPDTQTTRSTYRLMVQDHADGRKISFVDWNTGGDVDSALVAATERFVTEEFLAQFRPAFVVGPDGELLRLEGYEPIRDMLDSILRPMFDTMPGDKAPRLRFLDRLLSDEFLLSQVADEWNPLVWSWSDLDFEVGAVYEKDFERPSPIMPDELIPFHVENSLISRVPCEDGAADSACVSLVMRLVPDPDVLAPMAVRFLKQTSGFSNSLGKAWRMDIENIIRLVTEPATLTPHRLEIRQTVEISGPQDSLTKSLAGRQESVRRWVYRYHDPLPPPQVDGRRLQLAADSFDVYRVRGTDTTWIGSAAESLRLEGSRLTRAYLQVDSLSGTLADTVMARRDDLVVVEERYYSGKATARWRFDSTSASGWVRWSSRDSTDLNVILPPLVHNSSFFDVVVRASDLGDGISFSTPIFRVNGDIRRAEGRVIGSAMVKGRDCWVFEGRNGEIGVTFWIDKATRALRRSFIWDDNKDGQLLEAVR